MSTTRETRTPLSIKEYEALAHFRYLLREFLKFSETAALKTGIKPQQHQALLAIKGFSRETPLTIGDLAGKLQIRHHSAVGLVQRLITLKLVKKTISQEDKRVIHLSLTLKGEKILENLSHIHRKELQKIKPQLNILFSSLDKI